jgi:hypothetical protein
VGIVSSLFTSSSTHSFWTEPADEGTMDVCHTITSWGYNDCALGYAGRKRNTVFDT